MRLHVQKKKKKEKDACPEPDTRLTSKGSEDSFGVIPAKSKQQARMQKLAVEVLTDFSRQDHIQISTRHN